MRRVGRHAGIEGSLPARCDDPVAIDAQDPVGTRPVSPRRSPVAQTG